LSIKSPIVVCTLVEGRIKSKGVFMNAKLFESRNYNQAKTSANEIKFPTIEILLICILITVPLIGSNVLKYLDPGSGSLLLQTIMGMGMSSCAICGLPVAIIGAVVYFFKKKRNNNSQSDSTKESSS
jgi:hypothetical protein